ncbi:uracil permease [Effusibacillus lacus]|uniref:Uracil permease n=1 Tax=Effusibacillus lacus TaxID=1348429 RepID=A0A292YM02_9BACL|nr:uracil permease [Effusibacillus lacus]TCS75646.1 uracil permease [Effusibacillus lacus]GAX90968.1 uracil permease [Effusibacillus lacus]
MAQQRVVDIQEKLPLAQSLPLSLQHLFAMFGATVLVPFLTGLNPAVALLTSGIGTLLYIVLTKGQIPGYLGSSFAFIGPIIAVSQSQGKGAAMFGALLSGIVYIVVAAIVGRFGVRWLNKLMPPVVVGSIVIVIGLGLANVAVDMAKKNLLVAFVALVIAILASAFFRGFLGVIPILIGIVGGYAFAAIIGVVDLSKVYTAPVFSLPEFTTPTVSWTAALVIAPVALVTIAEHIGHLLVTENIVGRNLMEKPGLHRSLLGDGVATSVAALIGGPPTTTYGENIGVMAITRVYSVWVIGGAAVFAILFAFLGKLNALISSIPVPVMGGISILLFGIIASAGLRMLVESGINYGNKRNLIISSVILVVGVGHMAFDIALNNNAKLTIDSMALATIVGILLNLILPDLKEEPAE